MDFQFSDKVIDLQRRIGKFMDDHIYPIEHEWKDHIMKAGGWTTPPTSFDPFRTNQPAGAGMRNVEIRMTNQ